MFPPSPAGPAEEWFPQTFRVMLRLLSTKWEEKLGRVRKSLGLVGRRAGERMANLPECIVSCSEEKALAL